MLRYRVKKRETQSDCHLLDVWINRIKHLVTVKKAITHKNDLEKSIFFRRHLGERVTMRHMSWRLRWIE